MDDDQEEEEDKKEGQGGVGGRGAGEERRVAGGGGEGGRGLRRHLLDVELRDVVQRAVLVQPDSDSALWELGRPLVWLQLGGCNSCRRDHQSAADCADALIFKYLLTCS